MDNATTVFFETESPLGGRPRRESINDAANNAADDLTRLCEHVKSGDLTRARHALAEIQGWVDAIDDDLCERNADGSRTDAELVDGRARHLSGVDDSRQSRDRGINRRA